MATNRRRTLAKPVQPSGQRAVNIDNRRPRQRLLQALPSAALRGPLALLAPWHFAPWSGTRLERPHYVTAPDVVTQGNPSAAKGDGADRPPPNVRILLVECCDAQGLIHLITGVLASHQANIITNHEFVEREAGRFFMRTEFAGGDELEAAVDELRAALPHPARVRLGRTSGYRLVVFVTREHHCLAELLVRDLYHELGGSICAVVGNHQTLETLAERFGVPFHFLPHDGVSRETHEQAALDVLAQYEPDYLVLAKYMRLLSPRFVEQYAGRIVNIHHSFLPAFVGANPYRQAYERGVKIIGATAHFVTEALDEGPIIAQAVVPVDHAYGAADMARAGRDIEKIVLAKALQLVCEDRVFLSGSRAIVFD
jgi:formyltetrahydrofolate deformylase